MYFFQLLLGHLTDLQVASVDTTYQKLSPTTHLLAHSILMFPHKPSTQYGLQIQFAIYSKLLKHVQGLALKTSTRHTPTAAVTTGLKVGVRDHQQSLTWRPHGMGRYMKFNQVRDVRGCLTMKGSKSKHQNFKIDSKMDW